MVGNLVVSSEMDGRNSYGGREDEPVDVQMVVKIAAPAAAVLALIKAPK